VVAAANNTTMATITPVVTRIASGLRCPEGPVAMPDGTVLLVENARQTLSRVTPDGRAHVIATLGGGPNGAAMGPGGKIYVTNNGGSTRSRSDRRGAARGVSHG
jgi:sugar lactone lactonase YvrE